MKRRKTLAMLLSVCILGGLTASIASASSFSIGADVTVHNHNETINYTFDGKSAGADAPQIRCVTTARCSVSDAKVRYQLHRAYTNTVMDRTQTFAVGSKVEPWWFAAAGRYHVDFFAQSNYNSNGVSQAVYLRDVKVENFVH